MLELRILGPLEARAGERSLPLGGAKQRALLAILLLHANEVVSTDRLIDELWGESPPETAANTLQVYVSQLRKALEVKDAIATRPPGYALQLAPEQLDLGRFERLLEEGRRGRPARAPPPRPPPRPPRRRRPRARGARRRAPPPRVPARPAHARALPLGPPGGGARGLPGGSGRKIG